MVAAHKKIAILASGNLLPQHPNRRKDAYEFDEELAQFIPAFAQHGMEVSVVNWRDAAEVAEHFDAVLPLLVWDYYEENVAEFLAAMVQVSKKTKLFNNLATIQWNSNKSYLEELGRTGASTIPTVTVSKSTPEQIERAMAELGADTVVIKPKIGGGAWRQVRYVRGTSFPVRELLPPGVAMVQPYLESVVTEGEYSFLYFGGTFSHALVKRPKLGDYRVQSLYGGSELPYLPTEGELTESRAVLDASQLFPLYARVDLIRGDDGRLLLIELEMIEPYLYLSYAAGEGGENLGARRLASALANALSALDGE